ncbi:hypothetical protein BJP25_06115 [Actinokineospora bangkokensis]|uniref:Uncharacterized protein n=1 Tax=Actinokineospora bangkokensis TaxID=1193682 RepID=A0A1Q9LTJ5_9PSEU|nr:hypothetical protein BJP25_06115 [Actinokineospora bangkokensis]
MARRVALTYLVVVILVFTGVTIAVLANDSGDASFAPVLAFVVTLPVSVVLVILPEFPAPYGEVVGALWLVAAALVQAWLLWVLFRGHRRP